MSDQGTLFLPETTEELHWYEKPLACEQCKRRTSRPPRSTRPCSWCSGRLWPVVRA